MASISSPYPLSLRPSICHFTALSNRKGPRNRNPNTSFHVLARDITTEALGSVSSGTKHNIVLCCKNSEQQHRESRFRVQEGFGAKRRDFVLQMAATATFPLIIPNALAEKDVPENFRVYTDDVNKFKILIPQDWQVGAGEPNGFKSITAFYPEEASSASNVSVVITGLGADFTRMESLGKVDAFAETLVNGLDRSWQRPPGVAAKLIDCKASNGIYYIEYSLQNPGESRRRLFSAIGMASNGWYNRLYTVTGQFMEEESEKYSFNIEKTVASFRFI